MFGAASGDLRGDAQLTDPAAVGVVVVSAVGVHRLRAPSRPAPRLPRIGGTALSKGISWVTSLRLPPVRVAASGMPWASTITWCLLPALAPVHRGRTRLRPALHRAQVGGVHRRPGEVQQASSAQLSENDLFVQALPDPGLLLQSRNRRQHVIPEPKPSSCGRKAPRDAGVEHEQDAPLAPLGMTVTGHQ